ncbi:AhpC/TSA family protein [Niastella caeni]|uniref:AhpC/TSA family protein n=1 Tax=Niastella caeni TaxID=2569763 RepID=A0A4S8HST7_9BACT|nr:TlpA disulfide reductase family protein [Niastella caeni]THU38355.1 AhpC/TSA family protein [Niastella caeni]
MKKGMKTVKAAVAISLMTGASMCLSAQTAFRIKWNLKDTTRNGEKVTIAYFNGVKNVYSAAVIRDGVFTIEGTVADPARATMTISTTNEVRKAIPWRMSEKSEFYIEGGEVTLEGSPLSTAVIKAPGLSQKDFLAFQKKMKPFGEKERASYDDMLRAIIARDSLAKMNYTAINDRCKQQVDSVEWAYMKANPASHVSLGLLKEKVNAKSLSEEKELLKATYSKLSAPLKKTVVGKQLGELIEAAFKVGPGNKAEDIVLNDTLGNPVHLTSFRGKYVLLDFWASWCIPCRYENTTAVTKAYERFKDKNFTILSVSLEKPGDRKAWVAAIIKDKLTWTQVATLTAEENSKVTKLYGIQEIPMNFLIDPQGKIVAVHLRGEALIKKLEEIL